MSRYLPRRMGEGTERSKQISLSKTRIHLPYLPTAVLSKFLRFSPHPSALLSKILLFYSWVKTAQFDTRVSGSKLPAYFDLRLIATLFPRLRFACQRFDVSNAAVETLRGQHRQFAFRDIQPTAMFRCVMPLETFCQTSGFLRRKASHIANQDCACSGCPAPAQSARLQDTLPPPASANVRQSPCGYAAP